MSNSHQCCQCGEECDCGAAVDDGELCMLCENCEYERLLEQERWEFYDGGDA